MTCLPRGRFERESLLFRQHRNILRLDLALQRMLLRQTFHECSIAIGFLATQGVIEVAEDQIRESCLQQQMQQRHRVPTARDRQQYGRGWFTGGRQIQNDG